MHTLLYQSVLKFAPDRYQYKYMIKWHVEPKLYRLLKRSHRTLSYWRIYTMHYVFLIIKIVYIMTEFDKFWQSDYYCTRDRVKNIFYMFLFYFKYYVYGK